MKLLTTGAVLSITALLSTVAVARPGLKKLRDTEAAMPAALAVESPAPAAKPLGTHLAGIGKLDDQRAQQQENQLLVVEAAKAGQGDVITLHVQNGVNVNFIDDNDRSPLSYAVEANHTDVAKQLLEAGANPNVNQPIITAYKKGNTELVKELIKWGANPNVSDENGNTLAALAKNDNNTELYDLFIANGANPSFADQPLKVPGERSDCTVSMPKGTKPALATSRALKARTH
jgi:ankyrin repeat protein